MRIIVLALTLQTAAPLPATRQPDPPRHEGLWVVEVIDNIKVMPESQVTMRIEGSTISGSGPCNTYRGSWTAGVASGVKIGQLLKTMKACDPARMSEEADFFTLLNAVVGYEVRSNDTLILRTREGKTITARRSNPSSVP